MDPDYQFIDRREGSPLGYFDDQFHSIDDVELESFIGFTDIV